MFGLVASAVVETLVAPDLGPGVGRLAGAAAFGIGLVLLVVGRLPSSGRSSPAP